MARAQAEKTHCPKGHPYTEENTARNPQGHRRCRTCSRASCRKWRSENLELARALGREAEKKRAAKNPQRHREYHLRTRYGISFEDEQQMLSAQGNACAICQEPFVAEYNRGYAVDHCHKSTRVRGLLCRRCNVTLGQVDDQVKILRQMIEYLELHGERA